MIDERWRIHRDDEHFRIISDDSVLWIIPISDAARDWTIQRLQPKEDSGWGWSFNISAIKHIGPFLTALTPQEGT